MQRRLALLLIFTTLSGCATSEGVRDADGTIDDQDVARALVTITWMPAVPVEGDSLLLRLDASSAVEVLGWTIDGRWYEGATASPVLAAGTYNVTVQYVDGGRASVAHADLIMAPLPEPAVELPDEGDADPPSEDPDGDEGHDPEGDPGDPEAGPWEPGDVTIEYTVDKNRVRFDAIWDVRPTHLWWYFGDGTQAAKANPMHQYLETGTYEVEVVVFSSGHLRTSTALVTVEDLYLSMVATLDGNKVTAQAFWHPSSSYSWDLGDGTTLSGAAIEHTYASGGPYTVTVTAVSGSESETVSKPLGRPEYEAVVDLVQSDNVVDLSYTWGYDGTATWRFSDGTKIQAETASHRFSRVGDYVITLDVTDGISREIVSIPITVDTMRLVPSTAVEALDVEFSATWDLPMTTVEWTIEGVKTPGNPVLHAYPGLGVYTVWVYASDGIEEEFVQFEVTIHHTPLEILHAYPEIGGVPQPGNTIQFGIVFEPTPDNVVWDFGDGTGATGEAPIHQFVGGKGTYTVEATVTEAGLQAAGIASVTTTVDVVIEFDGMPQFDCGGTPVYEETLTHGQDGRTWMALKTGERLGVFWETATASAESIEVYENGIWTTYEEPNAARGHAFILEDLVLGEQVCIRWGDVTHGVVMQNAMNHYDDVYLTNYLVQAPGDFDPVLMQEGVAAAAELWWDAFEGHAALGRVVILHDWAAYTRSAGAPGSDGYACASQPRAKGTFTTDLCQIFDVQIAVSTPGAGGFTSLNGIKQKNAVITNDGSTYVDAAAGDAGAIREFRAVFVHESGHYAFGMDDKYVTAFNPSGAMYPPVPVYTCDASDAPDPGEDVSIMGGSRDATEFDTMIVPCPDDPWLGYNEDLGITPLNPLGAGRGPADPSTSSWTEAQVDYPLLPTPTGPQDAGPIGTGDHLQVVLLDFQGAG